MPLGHQFSSGANGRGRPTPVQSGKWSLGQTPAPFLNPLRFQAKILIAKSALTGCVLLAPMRETQTSQTAGPLRSVGPALIQQ